jgi:glyoxylase-like metal-dependent hydrolase (beta-lactamase superfamily II)
MFWKYSLPFSQTEYFIRRAGMEVRIDRHGPGSLATRVFFSDESGFEVASLIVMGSTDAVLIDAQWTLSNAHRVVAEILETGKQLKTIYVTHAHPDHYFGLGTIAEAFPAARVIALPEVARTINRQFFGKIEYWENIIGKTNVPRKTVNIEPMTDDYFTLEGQRIEIIPQVMGDLKHNTLVWIPSINTLYGSDVLFNQAHPFTCEVTAEQRQQWINDIKRIESMGASVIIPGHQKPGMPFDNTSCIFTREYLAATEEELARTTTTGDFYYAMVKRFPDANLFISNDMNASVFKGGMSWHWKDDE